MSARQRSCLIHRHDCSQRVGYPRDPFRKNDSVAGFTGAGSLAACVRLLAVASRHAGRLCLQTATVRCSKLYQSN